MSRLIELFSSASNWLKLGSKRGVSSIEYGLLAALIALVIAGSVTAAGAHLNGVFQSIAAKLPASKTDGHDPKRELRQTQAREPVAVSPFRHDGPLLIPRRVPGRSAADAPPIIEKRRSGQREARRIGAQLAVAHEARAACDE